MESLRSIAISLLAAVSSAVPFAAQAAPQAPASAYRQVDGGDAFTCGVTTAGAAKCWGRGSSGQLGDGTATDRSSPVLVKGLTSGVVAISAGGSHACALTESGTVYCWGMNVNGELGDGTTTGRTAPVLVRNLGGVAKAITAGYAHTCAVLTTGVTQCWGWNQWGQLGNGTTQSTVTPTTVKGLTGVTIIATASNTTCAVSGAGALKCWGANGDGQIGNGTSTGRTTPRAVIGFGTGTRSVAPSVSFTCAVTGGGAATCWGTGFNGELGDGSAHSQHFTPKPVLGLGAGVATVAAGDAHACARLTSGAARCWGANASGEVGDGTTTDRYRPVAVRSLNAGVSLVTAGDAHSCAVLSSGVAKCWGENLWGQIGDGTRGTDRLVPVAVAG